MTLSRPTATHARFALALFGLLAAGCEKTKPRAEKRVLIPGPTPALGSIDLRVDDITPLSPTDIVRLGPGYFLALDLQERALYTLRSDKARHWTVQEVVPSGRELKPTAQSLSPEGIGVLYARGTVRVLDPETFRSIDMLNGPPQAAGFRGISGLPDSSWLVLAEVLDPENPQFRRAKLLRYAAGLEKPQVVWESGLGTPSTGHLLDAAALTAAGDTVLVTGQDPARIHVISTANGANDSLFLLQNTPARRVPDDIRRAFEQRARRLPRAARRLAVLPENFPAAHRAWLIPGGFLVEASAGGGMRYGDFFMLDKYCGNSYASTLQLGNYMLQTTVLDDVIAVLRDMDSYRRLEFYSTEQFDISCK